MQEKINIPLIASGGMGEPKDLLDVVSIGKANAVSMADIIHYNRYSLKEIREFALKEKIEVRVFKRYEH